jgi:hypothetical protein
MKDLSILETHLSVGAENGLTLTGYRDQGDMPVQLFRLILMIKRWRAKPDDTTIHTVSDGT